MTAELVVCLPSVYKALGSAPSTTCAPDSWAWEMVVRRMGVPGRLQLLGQLGAAKET